MDRTVLILCVNFHYKNMTHNYGLRNKRFESQHFVHTQSAVNTSSTTCHQTVEKKSQKITQNNPQNQSPLLSQSCNFHSNASTISKY